MEIRRKTSAEPRLATAASERRAEPYSNQKSVERPADVTASCQTAADRPLARLTDELEELAQTSGTVLSLTRATVL